MSRPVFGQHAKLTSVLLFWFPTRRNRPSSRKLKLRGQEPAREAPGAAGEHARWAACCGPLATGGGAEAEAAGWRGVRASGGDDLDEAEAAPVLLVDAVHRDGVVAAVADVEEAAVGAEAELAAVGGGLRVGGGGGGDGAAGVRSLRWGGRGREVRRELAGPPGGPSRCPRGR